MRWSAQMSWEAGDIQGPDMGYDFGGQSGCDDGHSSEFTGAGDREEVCRHQERSYQAHGRASCALAIWAGGCGAGVETGCQDGSDGRPLLCKTGNIPLTNVNLKGQGYILSALLLVNSYPPTHLPIGEIGVFDTVRYWGRI